MGRPVPSTKPMDQLLRTAASRHQDPAGAATFDVTISHGQVTPTNTTWQAKVGQPITVRVTSDAADELHVHSSPDHEFEVAAAPNQLFTFTVNVPGSVDVELHKLDKRSPRCKSSRDR
jgi:hypothetical protein